MKLALAFTLLFPMFALAQRTAAESFLLEESNAVLSGTISPQVDCFDPKETPDCSKITQTYCSNLIINKGKASDSTGSVNFGKSERSQISELERANLVDTTRALAAIPPDLKSALEKPIARLASLIQTENDSTDWYKEVSQTRAQIAVKLGEVAKRRADASLRARLPQGRSATSEDKAAERDKQERELMEVFTRAKMETSPNWGKLKIVLSRVKEDMVAVINTLPLTPEEKQERLNRINQTNLTIPFGLRRGGPQGKLFESDCRTNMVNAMYMPLNGTLTVCAGLLNGLQSENSLYFILAHELAHSFNLNLLQQSNSRPRWSSLTKKMVEANGNIPCDEYARLSEESKNQDDYQCGHDRLNSFMSCVTGGRKVRAYRKKERYAQLVDETERVNYCGILDQNQGLAFMNPNEFADRNFPRLISSVAEEYTGRAIEPARGMLAPAFLIVQEKKCNPSRPCPEVVESARVRDSMETTPPHCMDVSLEGQENESDWYAHKAMIVRLRSVTDIRQRRELIASSMVPLCGYSYSRRPSDKELRELDKEIEKLAKELLGSGSHSTNDYRIEILMTEEMSSLLQCNRPGSKNSYSRPTYQECRL